MATVASNPAAIQAALAAARSQLGVPYHWAWEKPGVGFDCSGLTQWAWGQAGIAIPRTTVLQVTKGTAVKKADLQPGDLVFPEFPIHHVQIYSGNGMIIESPETGKNVREVPMWGFFTARRIVSGGAGVTDAQGFTLPSPGDVANAAGSMLIPGLPKFSDLLANSRGFMLRVIEFVVGGALILVAVANLAGPKVLNNPMVKTAVRAVK